MDGAPVATPTGMVDIPVASTTADERPVTTSSAVEFLPVTYSSTVNTVPETTSPAETSTYPVAPKNSHDVGRISNLESIADVVQKSVDQLLGSLVIKASSGIYVGTNIHFHSKDESAEVQMTENLGSKQQYNEKMENGYDFQSPEMEFEDVLYIPSSQRKDMLSVSHEINSGNELHSSLFEPRISGPPNDPMNQNSTNPFSSTTSDNPSLDNPLAQNQDSGMHYNVFFPKQSEVSQTPDPKCKGLDTTKQLDNHPRERYEVTDAWERKELQNTLQDRYEITDGVVPQDIPAVRQEANAMKLLEEAKPELESWPKKFIEKDGFRLGIVPGNFFKSPVGFFVELSNGAKYQILLGNDNGFSCDVDVYVDNDFVFPLRLRPGKSTLLEGPKYSKKGFVFLRAADSPASAGIQPKQEHNGLVRAVFLPEKVGRTRAVSEPISFSKNTKNVLDALGFNRRNSKQRSNTTFSGHSSCERSFDFSHFCEGASALQGEQEQRNFEKVEEIEINCEGTVELILRLVLRVDDPSTPCSEEISSLRPPPIWSYSYGK